MEDCSDPEAMRIRFVTDASETKARLEKAIEELTRWSWTQQEWSLMPIPYEDSHDSEPPTPHSQRDSRRQSDEDCHAKHVSVEDDDFTDPLTK